MHRNRDRQLAKKVGDAIGAARRMRGWTQEQLAGALEISTNHAGLLERGQRLPSLGMLIAGAEVLGPSLDDLLLGEGAAGTADRRQAGTEAARRKRCTDPT
jgi:transcriptional regulator with XRE-family HTH domain